MVGGLVDAMDGEDAGACAAHKVGESSLRHFRRACDELEHFGALIVVHLLQNLPEPLHHVGVSSVCDVARMSFPVLHIDLPLSTQQLLNLIRREALQQFRRNELVEAVLQVGELLPDPTDQHALRLQPDVHGLVEQVDLDVPSSFHKVDSHQLAEALLVGAESEVQVGDLVLVGDREDALQRLVAVGVDQSEVVEGGCLPLQSAVHNRRERGVDQKTVEERLCEESPHKPEVLEVVGVDTGMWVDGEDRRVVGEGLKEEIVGVGEFLRKESEPLASQASIVQPILPAVLHVHAKTQTLWSGPHDVAERILDGVCAAEADFHAWLVHPIRSLFRMHVAELDPQLPRTDVKWQSVLRGGSWEGN
ncbi:hypothetical protein BLNAU_648 [Blattamonas nauphoetae]|uniref:Uncharacterized protein n=1 Tax=Blattamonas nauphoetae TaxID=2049346 RepID=A0ABQ9YK42_9EUKA|nr:hypothetical protein BLNAU_648 [Blattamonas nauphoetae]